MQITADRVGVSLQAPQALSVLVIGYGNPGRQDDGLGPAAADAIAALAWPGVTVIDDYQLVIENVPTIVEHDVVWFVDAAQSGPAPYTLQPLLPVFDVSFTSHLVKPEALLAMAKQYFGRVPEAYLLGIRGYHFEFSEGLSEAAQNNLDCALILLKSRLTAALGWS